MFSLSGSEFGCKYKQKITFSNTFPDINHIFEHIFSLKVTFSVTTDILSRDFADVHNPHLILFAVAIVYLSVAFPFTIVNQKNRPRDSRLLLFL